MSNFDNWVSYPFSVDGIEFLSLINPDGSMYKTIKNMPIAIFNSYNEGSIRELIGSVSTMSKSEIQASLDKANAGYSQAYLALA